MPLTCKWCDDRDTMPLCGHCLGRGARCLNCGDPANLRDTDGDDFCGPGCAAEWHARQPHEPEEAA